MNFLRFLLLLLLFSSSFIAAGQSFNFTHIGMNDGLSSNRVNCILKDSKGFMWFGTNHGLNRYDGKNFRAFYLDPSDTNSLINNKIVSLFEDNKGRIWVGTSVGLSIYNPQTESFVRNTFPILQEYDIPRPDIRNIFKDRDGNYFFVSLEDGIAKYSKLENKVVQIKNNINDTNSIASNQVSDFNQDVHGNYWIIHKSGIIENIDLENNKVIYRNYELNQKYGSLAMDYNLTPDKDGDLWISVVSHNKGVFYFNQSNRTVSHFHESSAKARLNTNVIREIVEDDKGLIWISTDHGGINILNKKDFSVAYIRHDPSDSRSIVDNSINSIYKDNTGIIWIGTFKKGINFYHENLLNFNLVKPQTKSPDGVAYDDTNCFAEDKNGNLWVGSNEGGLSYYNRKEKKFKYFENSPGSSVSVPTNVIVNLLTDKNDELWIGTYFGGLFRYDGKKFTRYVHSQTDSNSISSDNVWKIFEDSQGNLWIGTLGEGLDLFDRKNNRFKHFKAFEPNSIHSNFISTIMEDRDGNIWIGTAYGIDVLDKKTKRFKHYLSDSKEKNTLSSSSIISIIQDKRNFIWVGTMDKLNLLDRNGKVMKVFSIEDGLPSNNIVSLIEDNNGAIWIGTTNGLSNLTIRTDSKGKYSYHFRNYNERDGLQSRVFNENSAYKTRDGALLFGGPNGFNIFNPEDIKHDKTIPKIMFSELQIFNRIIKPGDEINGRTVLEKSIVETPTLVLKNHENVFSIGFSMLNYFHPEKNNISYKLEGFDENWITAEDPLSKIAYTGLNPGEYTLKIRASDYDGIWNNEVKSLAITILPPFWKTNFALFVYILMILLALFLGRKVIVARTRMKIAIEQERKEVMRIHEMDMMKIKFFTNISHEFRTPLSLILTPMDRLLAQIENKGHHKHLLLMQRNAKRLLNLVDQLLDFRKIEVQEVQLTPVNGEIISFVKETCLSFSDVSEKKNIKFSFQSSLEQLETSFDRDKLERVLFNLLSNAFKFTPEDGEITVTCDVKEVGETAFLEIKVKDTGIGVPAENKERIFERFFQNEIPGNLINQGSGIGLSIAREFVHLHGGTIFVESEGIGSVFIVTIPVSLTKNKIDLSTPLDEFKNVNFEISVTNEKPRKDSGKQTLLLVEDNEDFRFYLKNNLQEHFNILEANNGKNGWKVALAEIPDLIVSDIMMPEMDGLELSLKIKKDIRTSHIPLILLTARSKEEQKIEGYNSGASAFISKPFNYEILLSRIRNLIEERELLKKSFQNKLEIKPSEISIVSLDQKLIAKAVELVENNISNSSFSVEEMGKELGMSRAHLYKKMLALTGKTPIEFIRMIRIKRAAQLLEKSQLSVSEVSYKVGINNVKCFSKYFRTEFDILPSQYANKFK